MPQFRFVKHGEQEPTAKFKCKAEETFAEALEVSLKPEQIPSVVRYTMSDNYALDAFNRTATCCIPLGQGEKVYLYAELHQDAGLERVTVPPKSHPVRLEDSWAIKLKPEDIEDGLINARVWINDEGRWKRDNFIRPSKAYRLVRYVINEWP